MRLIRPQDVMCTYDYLWENETRHSALLVLIAFNFALHIILCSRTWYVTSCDMICKMYRCWNEEPTWTSFLFTFVSTCTLYISRYKYYMYMYINVHFLLFVFIMTSHTIVCKIQNPFTLIACRLFACLVMASKVWDDMSMWNVVSLSHSHSHQCWDGWFCAWRYIPKCIAAVRNIHSHVVAIWT